MKKALLFLTTLLFSLANAQVEFEVAPPYQIKTITFKQAGQNVIPIFRLGEPFSIEFDDLYGTDNDYYFTITHCDVNWKSSNLPKQDYLAGMDDVRIMNYENSFNTLQMYSHYKLNIPSQKLRLLISGNYILKILNGNREVVFAKRFVLFEDVVQIPIQVKRGRDMKTIEQVQNLDFAVKMGDQMLQNPVRNIELILLQNGKWHTAKRNIKPQYTLGNDLIYKYDKETQFYGGNEFLYFDNNNIRVNTNNIARVTSGDLYNVWLYTNTPRNRSLYTFFPDINGNFQVRNNNNENPDLEADYAWVYFSLDELELNNKSIYVTGMFNNYMLTDENKMTFNKKTKKYEVAMLIKQGFTNFEYTLVNNSNRLIDEENAIDGNFFQTENKYTILAYYKGNNDRFYRVIGKGDASSTNIIN